jgi:hypothetical protein
VQRTNSASWHSILVIETSPRIGEEISLSVWGALVAVVKSELNQNSFGLDFPSECPDGGAFVCPRLLNNSGRDVSYQEPLFLPKQVRLKVNELGMGGSCSKQIRDFLFLFERQASAGPT